MEGALTGATVTEGAGGKMVFVKVRETYDLHTVKDKLTLIGVHTPTSSIIKRNYPGLLMQCKGYRPVSCDVRLACASMMPVDPSGVGTTEGDVAPEDLFNPLLYKAVSNWSYSQIEALIEANFGYEWNDGSIKYANAGVQPAGASQTDFDLYYGLLSQTHEWKHASPQAGLEMRHLIPLVYESYQNIGQNTANGADSTVYERDPSGGDNLNIAVQTFRGRSHPLPMLNTTVYAGATPSQTGFASTTASDVLNDQQDVPAPKVYCGLICVPPSRLHQLFYRLVVEWTIEFSQIRSIADITNYAGLGIIGATSHAMSYNFGASKILSEGTDLVDTSTGSDIKKVM